MLDFLFHWPPRMLFGVDSHKKIGEEMQGVSSKALIVCAKGPFRENGLYDDVKNSLERAGIQTYGMGDIDQNPRLSSVREGVAICKKETIDTVVAIGGGSAMDCTKLIAAAALYDCDPYEFVWGSRPQITKSLRTVWSYGEQWIFSAIHLNIISMVLKAPSSRAVSRRQLRFL